MGNLAGSVLLAAIVVQAGAFDPEPMRNFVLKVVEGKMTLPAGQLFLRAVLANWLVCLAVWMAAKTKDDTAKILLIFWCMFTFITCGYEHCVANMCGLMLGLLLPHEAAAGVTWLGYGYNLGLATLGNIVGGAVFVAGMYWLGSPGAHQRGGTATDEAVARPGAAPAGVLALNPDARD